MFCSRGGSVVLRLCYFVLVTYTFKEMVWYIKGAHLFETDVLKVPIHFQYLRWKMCKYLKMKSTDILDAVMMLFSLGAACSFFSCKADQPAEANISFQQATSSILQHDACSSLPSHWIHSEWGCVGISRCTLNSEFRNSYARYGPKSTSACGNKYVLPLCPVYSLISFTKRRNTYLVIIISISSVSADRWNKRPPCFQVLIATTGGKPNCPFGSRAPQVEETLAHRFRNGGWNRSKACTIAHCPSN